MHAVDLDFDGSVVTIDYDAADTDVAALEAALEGAGYEALQATAVER